MSEQQGKAVGPAPLAVPQAWDPRGTHGVAGSEAPVDRRRPGRSVFWPEGRAYER